MATKAYYDQPLMTAETFLEIDFPEGIKAELDNGIIRLMAGGTARHAHIQGNIYVSLRERLRGTDCLPYNSDMAVRTGARSIRYPDVAVYCSEGRAPEDDGSKAFERPALIFEILSAGTARSDLRVKLEEYKALPSVETIVFVDAVTERVRVVQRTGESAWSDVAATTPIDVPLPSLGLILPHAEIFARD